MMCRVERSGSCEAFLNTSPTRKRHTGKSRAGNMPEGSGVFGIENPEVGWALSKFLAAYEHLETIMPKLLALLLGGYDDVTAGYVFRAIRNPSTKRELLQSLLEKAPINSKVPHDIDEMLDEYKILTGQRNQLAHGKWFTHDTDGNPTFVSRFSEHGWDLIEASEISAEEIDTLANRATALGVWIVTAVDPILDERRKASQSSG